MRKMFKETHNFSRVINNFYRKYRLQQLFSVLIILVLLPIAHSENGLPGDSKLFFCDSNQIKVYDFKTNKTSLYHKTSKDIVTFDLGESQVFFVEKNSSAIQAVHGASNNVTFSKKVQPQAIAVDSLTKKFYVLDKSAGTVSVIDFDVKNFGIILSNLDEPHDIVLDVAEGLMFILQYMKSILRANLDGAGSKELTKNEKISALSVDRGGKRIFYADDSGQLLSSDYEGENRKIFMESSIKNVKTLAFHENRLFFLHSVNSSVGTEHKVSALWTCELDGESCEDAKQLTMLFQDSSIVKAPADLSYSTNLIENPCKINNGDCSHLCLLASNKRRTCACRTGYQLSSDSRSCKLVNDIILYIESNYIKGIPLNSKKSSDETFKDVVVPTRLSPGNWYLGLSHNYDKQNDNFYFYGPGAIKFTSLMNESKTKVLINGVPVSGNLVFDKFSNNFYYIDDNTDNLKVAHFKRNRLLKKNLLPGHNVQHFTISPHRGQILFTAKRAGLYSANTDGSNLKNMSSDYELFDKVISSAWDHEENTVYFLDGKRVFFKNFNDLSDDTFRYDVPVRNAQSISVYKECVYISNSTDIWRVDKTTGKYAARVFKNNGKRLISDFTIFSTTDESNDDDDVKVQIECMRNDGKLIPRPDAGDRENECERNNGDCEHFCFSKPHKTCSCMDGYQLKSNGHCSKLKS